MIGMQRPMVRRVAAQIAEGQSLSGTVFGHRLALIGVEMPSEWTAAPLSFQLAPTESGPWRDLWDWAGNEFVLVVDANRFVPFDPRAALMVEWLRVRSGSSALPVAQAADREIVLVFRAIG
jgi:hypothetical protein